MARGHAKLFKKDGEILQRRSGAHFIVFGPNSRRYVLAEECDYLRALLLERGIVAPQGRRKLEEELTVFADEEEIVGLSPRIRLLIEDLRAEWRVLDERIAAFDGEFVRMARDDEAVRRLTKISGIGTHERDRAGGRRRQCQRVPARS